MKVQKIYVCLSVIACLWSAVSVAEDQCEATISKDLTKLGLGSFDHPTANKTRNNPKYPGTDLERKRQAIDQQVADYYQQISDYKKYGPSKPVMSEVGGNSLKTTTVSKDEFTNIKNVKLLKALKEQNEIRQSFANTELVICTNKNNEDAPCEVHSGDNNIVFSDGKNRLRVLLNGNIMIGYQITQSDDWKQPGQPTGKSVVVKGKKVPVKTGLNKPDTFYTKTVIFKDKSCTVDVVDQFEAVNDRQDAYIRVNADLCRWLESNKNLADWEKNHFSEFQATAKEQGSDRQFPDNNRKLHKGMGGSLSYQGSYKDAQELCSFYKDKWTPTPSSNNTGNPPVNTSTSSKAN